ncbi:MAG: DUF4349 domain-containing protein [Chloroflexi bacterium]|nr:MAG: DUF4349 domain-containing protein [Chloroflexota bacterium]TMD74324.1 MAG: DUF4349 domain-containing protein [Chloroflexota bacterium]
MGPQLLRQAAAGVLSFKFAPRRPGHMKKVLVIVSILAAAAACGGGNTAGSSTSSNGGTSLSQPASGGGQTSKAAGQPNGTTGGTTTLPGDTVPALAGPPVIRQAQLAVSVSNGSFDSKLAQVRTLVESEGGYIAGTDAQANPASNPEESQIRTGVISFMVPAAHFDDTIDQLSKVGKVQSEHITGTDVSAQYVDLHARLANAEAQHAAMLALLTKAQNINDIIAVQNQIGQITAQIEQLKGQIKYLDDNTSYSNVSVTLTEAGAPAQAASSDNWGFATALSAAAHNFVTTIDYFVTGLGAVGPFIVLAGIGFLVWRRRRTPQPKHA